MKKHEKELLQHTLNNEAAVIKKLEQVYIKSLNDIVKKSKELQDRINSLTDALETVTDETEKSVIQSMIQSKVYQKQYQDALKKQIGSILDNMQVEGFKAIDEYLQKCYEDGFIGVMYSLKNQGIPLIMPINQESMVNAVQLDSKISEGLYNHLGENAKDLKKSITAEISRGISNGSSFAQVAQQLTFKMIGTYDNAGGALAYAMRIARTEGHRVQIQSAMDACYKAKDKGCDIVKQWDATLDKRTRRSHGKVDGEIRELDEKFSNGLMFPGDPDGMASEVINCRCALLQRAKWALDEEELETLKQRAEYFELDKTDNFEEFKEKYLEATYLYTENERITKNIKFAIDSNYIESREYSNKFDAIAKDKEEKRMFLQVAKDMLHHRSGQNGEDLYIYNRNTKKIYKSTIGTEAGKPEYTEEILTMLKKYGSDELIAFHNHPSSMPPSASDINSALYNNYNAGYTICHDGKIFEYTASRQYIDDAIYNLHIEKYKKKRYNESEAQLEAMKYLSKQYGFSIKEVK